MVYNYLLNLYQVLDKRKEDIELEISQLSNESKMLHCQKGRLVVINEFKDFLTASYHEKLPRRIQKLHN